MVKKLCLALDQKERKMVENGSKYGESEKGPQPGCVLQAETTGIACVVGSQA